MKDDTISRAAAIDAINNYFGFNTGEEYGSAVQEVINGLPPAQPEQRWIPVMMRPMDSEEREYWEEHVGFTLTDDEAQGFDCPMPGDGQRIWVQTKNGFVFDDVCESDCDGIGLETNGDWDDIVAWMPMYVPMPWKGEDDGVLESDTAGTI